MKFNPLSRDEQGSDLDSAPGTDIVATEQQFRNALNHLPQSQIKNDDIFVPYTIQQNQDIIYEVPSSHEVTNTMHSQPEVSQDDARFFGQPLQISNSVKNLHNFKPMFKQKRKDVRSPSAVSSSRKNHYQSLSPSRSCSSSNVNRNSGKKKNTIAETVKKLQKMRRRIQPDHVLPPNSTKNQIEQRKHCINQKLVNIIVAQSPTRQKKPKSRDKSRNKPSPEFIQLRDLSARLNSKINQIETQFTALSYKQQKNSVANNTPLQSVPKQRTLVDEQTETVENDCCQELKFQVYRLQRQLEENKKLSNNQAPPPVDRSEDNKAVELQLNDLKIQLNETRNRIKLMESALNEKDQLLKQLTQKLQDSITVIKQLQSQNFCLNEKLSQENKKSQNSVDILYQQINSLKKELTQKDQIFKQELLQKDLQLAQHESLQKLAEQNKKQNSLVILQPSVVQSSASVEQLLEQEKSFNQKLLQTEQFYKQQIEQKESTFKQQIDSYKNRCVGEIQFKDAQITQLNAQLGQLNMQLVKSKSDAKAELDVVTSQLTKLQAIESRSKSESKSEIDQVTSQLQKVTSQLQALEAKHSKEIQRVTRDNEIKVQEMEAQLLQQKKTIEFEALKTEKKIKAVQQEHEYVVMKLKQDASKSDDIKQQQQRMQLIDLKDREQKLTMEQQRMQKEFTQKEAQLQKQLQDAQSGQNESQIQEMALKDRLITELKNKVSSQTQNVQNENIMQEMILKDKLIQELKCKIQDKPQDQVQKQLEKAKQQLQEKDQMIMELTQQVQQAIQQSHAQLQSKIQQAAKQQTEQNQAKIEELQAEIESITDTCMQQVNEFEERISALESECKQWQNKATQASQQIKNHEQTQSALLAQLKQASDDRDQLQKQQNNQSDVDGMQIVLNKLQESIQDKDAALQQFKKQNEQLNAQVQKLNLELSTAKQVSAGQSEEKRLQQILIVKEVELGSLKNQLKKYKVLVSENDDQQQMKELKQKSQIMQQDLQVKDMMISQLQLQVTSLNGENEKQREMISSITTKMAMLMMGGSGNK